MTQEYSELQPIKTYGGPDAKHNGDQLLSQSQHVLANDKHVFVSMLLNRNIRALNISDGSFVCDISQMGFSDDEFEMAAGMSFFKDNELLVTDLNANKIMSFNMTDFSYLGLPLGKYEFDKPNCIRTDDNNNIYVGEVGDYSRKLRCFDGDLKEQFVIKQAGGYDFLGVNYVSVDAHNKQLLITDSDLNAVHVYTDKGDYKFSMSESGADVGQFTYPTGTAVDSKGNILVCDTGNSRVQVFDKEGKFICMFGNKDTFVSPMDIHVTKNDEVVVVDGSVFTGWSRVQIFKY